MHDQLFAPVIPPEPDCLEYTDEVYVFDVDGVLTGKDKKIPAELFDQIERLLRSERFVAFNTGRDLEWFKAKVLTPLIERVGLTGLNRMFAVAEKGAHTLHIEGEEIIEEVDSTYAAPKVLRDAIRQYVLDNPGPYFHDEGKKVTVTIERTVRDGGQPDEEHRLFEELKPKLKSDLAEVIERVLRENTQLPNVWKAPDATAIAVDVEHRELGKGLGAQKIAQWLSGQVRCIGTVHSFGDSPSDREMHDHFRTVQGVERAKFHFVGSITAALQDIPAGEINFEYAGKKERGTLEITRHLGLQPDSTSVFEAGKFHISYLQPFGEGLKIESESVRRREARDPIIEMSASERAVFRSAYEQERRLNGFLDVTAAKRSYLTAVALDPNSEETAQCLSTYRELRRRYVAGMAGKIGIKSMHREGDTVHLGEKLRPTLRIHYSPMRSTQPN